MSQTADTNLAVMRRLFAVVNETRQLPPELHTPDYTFDVSAFFVELPEPLSGVAAAQEVLGSYWQMFDDIHTELEAVLHASSDCVVVVVRDDGCIRGSTARVSNRFFHVLWFRDGKIANHAIHVDRDRALAAIDRKS